MWLCFKPLTHTEPDGVSEPSPSAADGQPYILLPVRFPAEDAQVSEIANRGLSETAVFIE
jgi:hypothetical protein